MRDSLEGCVLRNSGWSAAAELAHLLPQRNRGIRVVTGACHQLEADPIGLGFLLATVRQL